MFIVIFKNDAQRLLLKNVGEFEAAILSHVKINAMYKNKTYLTVCPNDF